MKLLVVESPTKVKKLAGFLETYEPRQWLVVATAGHFRGLAPMAGQAFLDIVDVANRWAETFEIIDGKAGAVERLRKSIDRCREVYLAADDDREGEAIAWHVQKLFGLRNPKRVRCREITQTGIVAGVEAAGKIDLELVGAQRARSVLDYLIGMEVSRRLWRFGAKSAGRLQSAALRIIVDREKAIEAFEVEDFWRLFVDFEEGLTASVCTSEKPTPEELDDNPDQEAGARLVPKRFKTEEGPRAVGSGPESVKVTEAERTECRAGNTVASMSNETGPGAAAPSGS